jgi:hypothetical protein
MIALNLSHWKCALTEKLQQTSDIRMNFIMRKCINYLNLIRYSGVLNPRHMITLSLIGKLMVKFSITRVEIFLLAHTT